MAIVFTPPYSRDDEFRHFVRAYDLSINESARVYTEPEKTTIGVSQAGEDGKLWMVELPYELWEMRNVSYTGNVNHAGYISEVNFGLCLPKLWSLLEQPEIEQTVKVSETGTSERGMIAYWPQVLLMKLGEAIGVRSGYLYYLACMGQMLACTILLWISMKLIARSRNLIWLFSFVPVAILLRGSCNTDGLMMAEIVLELAIILHLRENKISIYKKKGILFMVLYLFLLYNIYVMKLPYMLLCAGFILFLKKDNVSISWVSEKCKKIKYRWLIVVVPVIILAVYVLAVRRGDLIFKILCKFMDEDHIEYWMNNFSTITSLMLHKGKDLLVETFGSMHGETKLHYGWLAVVVLLLSKREFGWISKLYQILLFLVMLELIVMFGYTLTPPDYGMIWGVTYRYILPFVPVFGLMLPIGNEKTEKVVNQYYPILLLTSVMMTAVLWAMV